MSALFLIPFSIYSSAIIFWVKLSVPSYLTGLPFKTPFLHCFHLIPSASAVLDYLFRIPLIVFISVIDISGVLPHIPLLSSHFTLK